MIFRRRQETSADQILFQMFYQQQLMTLALARITLALTDDPQLASSEMRVDLKKLIVDLTDQVAISSEHFV